MRLSLFLPKVKNLTLFLYMADSDNEYKEEQNFGEDEVENRIFQASDEKNRNEEEIKEELKNEFLSIESTFLQIDHRFYLPKYKELCERLSDVSSKIDLTNLITEDFEKLVDILIDGANTPGEHHPSNLLVIYSLCDQQTCDIGAYMVAQGLLNTLVRLLDERDMPFESVAIMIKTLASLAHMNQKLCYDVQKKFSVFRCHDIFDETQEQEIAESCANFFSSVSRFPLNDNEISSILDAFNKTMENEMEFIYSPMSYAASHVCGRKGQNTSKLINQFETINQLIFISNFNDEAKINMINSITLSSRDPNILFTFNIEIILDELQSENVDISAAAANCISALVQNRPSFLDDFNIIQFITRLLIVFNEESIFKARRYVAEAICSLSLLISVSDIYALVPNNIIECITFLIDRCMNENKQINFIVIHNALKVMWNLFESSIQRSKLVEVSNKFDEEGGFQYICDIFQMYKVYPYMTESFIDFLDNFMTNFAPESYHQMEVQP